MSPLPDLQSLMPTDTERQERRDALVNELTAASRSAAVGTLSRRRFVGGGLALTGVAAAALGAGIVVSTVGGPSVGLVASARAAVAPRSGDIFHVLIRYEHGPYVSMAKVGDTPSGPVRGTYTGDTETWSTREPVRHRIVRFLDPPAGGPQPTVQEAYANGVLRRRSSWRDDIDTRRLGAQERADREHPDGGRGRQRLAGLGAATDPLAAIRGLLSDDLLRENGAAADVGGRAVRRLVGQQPGYDDAGGSRVAPVDVEVLVDAETSAPVRVTTTQVLPARPDAEEPDARRERRIVDRWTFERFERLPETEKTLELLQLQDR